MFYPLRKLVVWSLRGAKVVEPHGKYTARVVRVYDGDTVIVAIWHGFRRRQISIRLLGVDCPEIRTRNRLEKACGLYVREQVKAWIGSCATVIIEHPDKFSGRYDAKIKNSRGEDLSEWLLSHGYAREYTGKGKRLGWSPEFFATLVAETEKSPQALDDTTEVGTEVSAEPGTEVDETD